MRTITIDGMSLTEDQVQRAMKELAKPLRADAQVCVTELCGYRYFSVPLAMVDAALENRCKSDTMLQFNLADPQAPFTSYHPVADEVIILDTAAVFDRLR